MSSVIALCTVAVIMLVMYLYMTNRMEVLVKQEKERTYKPNAKRTRIEVLCFIVAYLVGSYLAMIGNFNLALFLSATVISFSLSFLLVSKLTFELLGKWVLTVVSTIVMVGFYILIYFTAK